MNPVAPPASPTTQLGGLFFRYRDVLPVPLALLMVKVARPRALNWLIGLPLVFLGELVRLWGLRYIGPTTRTRDICADRLVTGGPYARVRHPLYLANALKVLGLLVIAGHLPFALLTLAFYALEFVTMIPFEEQFLEQKFPEAFALYKEAVPVFLPNGSVFNSDFEAHFTWTEALRSERRTFMSTGLILGVLGLAGLFRGLPVERS